MTNFVKMTNIINFQKINDYEKMEMRSVRIHP